MKKIVGLFLIVILFDSYTISTSYTISKDTDKIVWSNDYQLQWKDFAGSVKDQNGMDAMTACVVEPKKDKEGNASIICYFDKKSSWRIKKKETDNLLRHEQYHFNLSEIFTRKIRKEVIEKKAEYASKEFNKIFKKIWKDCEKEQRKYDKETNHSRVSEEQSRWETEIDKQLQELNDFSNPIIN